MNSDVNRFDANMPYENTPETCSTKGYTAGSDSMEGSRTKIKVRRLFVNIGVLVTIVVLVMLAGGIIHISDRHEVFRLLSDGFFTGGFILLALDCLWWIAGDGTFDAIGFTTKTFFSLKWSYFGDFKEKFYEYKERKKRTRFSKEMAIAGGIGIIVAVIYLVMYER